jgi:hypothetical protein
MTLGKTTFDLNKSQYNEKIGRIIGNHRAGSRLCGEPAEFILRSCRLTEQWGKLGQDSETAVYLRNVEIAGGRKVKMLSLERAGTRQPISKSKLVEALYPTKKIATAATAEEKHYNAVKSAMRGAVKDQLKRFRDQVELPCVCCLTGKQIRRGMRTDVDHTGLSFSEIADIFMTENKLRYTDIALVGPPTAKKFRLETLWESWKKFHNEKARYAIVLASANRSKGCGEYETPEGLYGSFAASSSEELSLEFD